MRTRISTVCRSRRTGRHILFCGLTLLLASCAPKDQPEVKAPENSFHPYGLQHGVLHFEHEGMSRGTETMWIDSFGRLERHETDAEQITEKGFLPRRSLSIKHGAEVTIVDTGAHKVWQFIEPVLDSLYSLPEGSIPQPGEQFARYFSRLNYKMIGDTTLVGGLRAHIWRQQFAPNTLLEWNGMIVGNRTEGKGGAVELVLRSIDTTSVIPHSMFDAPPNLPVEHGLPHP